MDYIDLFEHIKAYKNEQHHRIYTLISRNYQIHGNEHHPLSILGREINNNPLKELPSGIFSNNTKLSFL